MKITISNATEANYRSIYAIARLMGVELQAVPTQVVGKYHDKDWLAGYQAASACFDNASCIEEFFAVPNPYDSKSSQSKGWQAACAYIKENQVVPYRSTSWRYKVSFECDAPSADLMRLMFAIGQSCKSVCVVIED